MILQLPHLETEPQLSRWLQNLLLGSLGGLGECDCVRTKLSSSFTDRETKVLKDFLRALLALGAEPGQNTDVESIFGVYTSLILACRFAKSHLVTYMHPGDHLPQHRCSG